MVNKNKMNNNFTQLVNGLIYYIQNHGLNQQEGAYFQELLNTDTQTRLSEIYEDIKKQQLENTNLVNVENLDRIFLKYLDQVVINEINSKNEPKEQRDELFIIDDSIIDEIEGI